MLHRFHFGIAGSLGWAVFLCVNLAVSSAPCLKKSLLTRRNRQPRRHRSIGFCVPGRPARIVRRHFTAFGTPRRCGTPSGVGGLPLWAPTVNVGSVATTALDFNWTPNAVADRSGREKTHQATAYDGRVISPSTGRNPRDCRRRGKIWSFGGRAYRLLNREMMPLAWVYRPSLRLSLDPERFRLVTEDAIVNSLRCTKLRG